MDARKNATKAEKIMSSNTDGTERAIKIGKEYERKESDGTIPVAKPIDDSFRQYSSICDVTGETVQSTQISSVTNPSTVPLTATVISNIDDNIGLVVVDAEPYENERKCWYHNRATQIVLLISMTIILALCIGLYFSFAGTDGSKPSNIENASAPSSVFSSSTPSHSPTDFHSVSSYPKPSAVPTTSHVNNQYTNRPSSSPSTPSSVTSSSTPSHSPSDFHGFPSHLKPSPVPTTSPIDYQQTNRPSSSPISAPAPPPTPPNKSFEGWRIWTPDYLTVSGWAWDVAALEFFENESCEGNRIDPSGTAISSGFVNENWRPEGAFNGFVWGGRPDDDGNFWLGMIFSSKVAVRCIKMVQYGDKLAKEMIIQAYDGISWNNIYTAESLLPPTKVNIISLFPPESITIKPSIGWRIWTPDYHTASGWAWDVEVLEFYENENCEGNKIDPSGTVVSSGYADENWLPEGAFNGFAWGGRPDDDGNFWLGIMFSSEVTVLCVKMKHLQNDKGATEMIIQTYYQNDVWKDVYHATNLLNANETNNIPLLPPLASSFKSAKGWRIWTPDYQTTSGWAWDVEVLVFFENENCEGNRIDPSGTAVSSGHANEDWLPEGAFNGFAWGGRPDNNGNLWLGMMFSSNITVRCIKMKQFQKDKEATEMTIQAYVGNIWRNVYHAQNLLLAGEVNIISV